MGFIVRKVDRTEIVLGGEVSAQKLHEVFDEICGERLASLKVVYDDHLDLTTVFIYPCRTFKIVNGPFPSHKLPVSEERKIRIAGRLPDHFDVVDGCWVPIRKRAKKDKDEVQWVVMYTPSKVTDKETGRISTELGFIVDFRCKKELETDTLDRAADAVSECLRKMASDIRVDLMESAWLCEQISMEFSEKLDQLDQDEIEANYRAKGLRYVNTDALV